jgi:hypothetical protein
VFRQRQNEQAAAGGVSVLSQQQPLSPALQ